MIHSVTHNKGSFHGYMSICCPLVLQVENCTLGIDITVLLLIILILNNNVRVSVRVSTYDVFICILLIYISSVLNKYMPLITEVQHHILFYSALLISYYILHSTQP